MYGKAGAVEIEVLLPHVSMTKARFFWCAGQSERVTALGLAIFTTTRPQSRSGAVPAIVEPPLFRRGSANEGE